MSGKVWEWCSDFHGKYSSQGKINPKGPTQGKGRVLRGGGFLICWFHCRSTNRDGDRPEYKQNGMGGRDVKIAGFRLVLPVDPQN
jgi:formylglycine-generating enzyme required for sulfatase activity